MAYNTPYQVKLQGDSFYDSDNVAAAWRLLGTQIKVVYKEDWDNLVLIAASLDGHYKSYLRQNALEKTARFNLKVTITDKLDPSGLQNYHAKLRDTDTVNRFRNFSLVLYHLQDMFGVPAETLAGVMAGSLLMEMGLQEIVAQEIATQLGGGSVITEIPGGSLAGQYKPSHFPQAKSRGDNQMAFRRRY